LKEIWAARNDADIIIGSRFARGGSSEAPIIRHLLSLILNSVFSIGLSIPVKDISSGYRLYKREALNLKTYRPENFNILQEVLVRAYAGGFSIKEVPLRYEERASGESHVSLVKFAISYLPTFYRLWKVRNSLSTADYEHRSYSSRHPLQRYWVRKRIELIKQLLGEPKRVLDIGSGSSVLATMSRRKFAFSVDEVSTRSSPMPRSSPSLTSRSTRSFSPRFCHSSGTSSSLSLRPVEC
jgi:DNA-binding transcriptional MerR regulator